MATVSAVNICNGALVELGEATINSLSDDNTRARVCNQIFDNTRDFVLAEHPWNFAIERQAIAADTESPLYEYTFQYTLPTDPYCLRALDFDGSELGWTWKVEGRKLLTDCAAPLNLRYIARRTNYQEFQPSFIEALEARIALKLAQKISRLSSLVDSMAGLYKDKIRIARSTDGQEGSPQKFIVTDWTGAR